MSRYLGREEFGVFGPAAGRGILLRSVAGGNLAAVGRWWKSRCGRSPAESRCGRSPAESRCRRSPAESDAGRRLPGTGLSIAPWGHLGFDKDTEKANRLFGRGAFLTETFWSGEVRERECGICRNGEVVVRSVGERMREWGYGICRDGEVVVRSVGERMREWGCGTCRDGEVIVAFRSGSAAAKQTPDRQLPGVVRMDSAAKSYFLTMVTCRGFVAAALAAVISSIHSFMSSTPPWLQPEPA